MRIQTAKTILPEENFSLPGLFSRNTLSFGPSSMFMLNTGTR
nr:MAG TPA: hypothetical protein [Caudoviricetes sp.]